MLDALHGLHLNYNQQCRHGAPVVSTLRQGCTPWKPYRIVWICFLLYIFAVEFRFGAKSNVGAVATTGLLTHRLQAVAEGFKTIVIHNRVSLPVTATFATMILLLLHTVLNTLFFPCWQGGMKVNAKKSEQVAHGAAPLLVRVAAARQAGDDRRYILLIAEKITYVL